MKPSGALALAVVLAACSPPPVVPRQEPRPAVPTVPEPTKPEPAPPKPETDELGELLRADPDLAAILADAPKRRLQVAVAVPTPEGLKRLSFRVDADYFYPASAVKLLVASSALEKLAELRDGAGDGRRHPDVTLRSRLRFIDGAGSTRKVVTTTLRGELEKALVLSDNDAHNRLFDFVGRDELGELLARVSLPRARIMHYLGEALDHEPPVIEFSPAGRSIYVAQRNGFAAPPPPTEGTALGKAYINGSGQIVQRPMEFAEKNYVPLRELQDILVATMRPDLVDPAAVPRLSPGDRAELRAVLSTLPSELKQMRGLRADQLRVVDETYKSFHRAFVRARPTDRLRVYGKSGRAFGFSVENVYVADETTGRSLFAAVTIYAHDSGTVGDDRYEYESVASPFVGKVAELLARTYLAGPASPAPRPSVPTRGRAVPGTKAVSRGGPATP